MSRVLSAVLGCRWCKGCRLKETVGPCHVFSVLSWVVDGVKDAG